MSSPFSQKSFNRLLFLIIPLIYLCILVIPLRAKASPTLVFTNEKDIYGLVGYLDILEDSTQKLTIEDVVSKEHANRFVPDQGKNLNFNFSPNVFWIRLRVQNMSKETLWHIFEVSLRTRMIDSITLYIPDENGIFAIFREKEGVLIKEKGFQNSPDSFFSFVFPTENVKTIYFRIQDEGLLFFPLSFYNRASIQTLIDLQYIKYTLIGAYAFFLLYNLCNYSGPLLALFD
ncbi:hypothetical protein KKA14_03600 [bacterium]|nr:hypothetical protein [bacterium]